MTLLSQAHEPSEFERSSDLSTAARQKLAVRDALDALRGWRLTTTLAWLDIRLRYRGSLLGPFWLTMSIAVMILALGLLYSTLLKIDLHDYMPFLAVSLVLWGYLNNMVIEACTSFTSAEGTIRAMRMPYIVHASRVVARNVLVVAHSIVIIVAVFAVFRIWPGWHLLLCLPGLAVWLLDSLAAALLLGTFCARFRDIPPIVANVMQIAFFMSPIVWKPELVGESGWWLPLNPFYSLLEIVRTPMLGAAAPAIAWVSALAYSVLLCAGAWVTFARARARLAFWV